MEITTITEVTENSFRITWNHDESENVLSRTLYLYEGNSENHIYSVPNVAIEGSQLFTQLKPNFAYRAVIYTTFSDSNIAALDSQFVTTLQIKDEISTNPNVTANLPKTKNYTGYWAVGIFLTLMMIIIAIAKSRKEAVE